MKKVFVLGFFIISVLIFTFVIKFTYSADSPPYNITFMNYEGEYVINKCTTDSEGRLSDDCKNVLKSICRRYSTSKLRDNICSKPGYTSKSDCEKADGTWTSHYYGTSYDGTFNAGGTYYCVSGWSSSDHEGVACYTCQKNGVNYYKWDVINKSISDNACGTYTAKDIYNRSDYSTDGKLNVDTCKNPNVCYTCSKDGKNYYKWQVLSGDPVSDSSCGTYSVDPNVKSQSACSDPVVNSCYVCKSNSNILKWASSGIGDNNCSGGYDPINKSFDECVPIIDNPKTGSIAIFFVWVIGIITFGYAFVYFKNVFKKEN